MIHHITIHPSVVIWLSILYYLTPEVVLPFLLASAVHEIGHGIMLTLIKKPPKALTITFSGAIIETPPLSYRETVLAAAAGPLVSLVLTLSLPIFPNLGVYSLILGLVNLIPISGLDGSKILGGILNMKLLHNKAETILAVTETVTSAFLFLSAVTLSIYTELGTWPIILASVFLLRSIIPSIERS